jgi:integrase/recombinase XerD
VNEDLKRLLEAILDYLCGIRLAEVQGRRSNSACFTKVLIDFFTFAMRENIPWNDLFTYDTFREFRKYTPLRNTAHAIIGLSAYLHRNGRVAAPLKIPNYQVKLPDIYEQYFLYLEQTREISQTQVNSVRRVLASFHAYLESRKIKLSAVKINHLDAFMAEFKVARTTLKTYRHLLRGFLKYLYQERRILKRDLAPLLGGARLFDQKKPPRFLRPQEVQKLFASLRLSTPVDIRTYAMVHLAYTLGLRPIEICKITLDDISFQKEELTVRNRKTKNPTILPLPQQTMKAIAAYIMKARPKTGLRDLFLTHVRPHRPVSPETVVGAIRSTMRQAGLSSSAYWLRHTYAQNLLRVGRSIYEIKEMLGHGNIQSTQRYLYIDTERMRKVLFHETL